ncbi:glycoside hydrolase family 99-like domain-containing protein [Bosea sp. 117]|uniref:glycoside hydrolase family 99-like domain-containing protein n=1 Tax=Bosea sp. 117 TaxID=1125973 RepID=UPI0006901F8F|nr:glycoside hydrolase family 99-like domain-containing protein [Bosea sp. 117]
MAISSSAIRRALSSGLIDGPWYIERYALPPKTSALSHFLSTGWRKGRAPNRYFDPDWYRESNPAVAAAGIDPLTHYIEQGEAEGRWPCRVFDPAFYAKTYGVELGGGAALAHFVRDGAAQGLRPNAWFDPHHYIEKNVDLPRNVAIAASHYIEWGHKERRAVSAEFNAPWYRAHYQIGTEADPIQHYVTVGQARGFAPNREAIVSPASEVRRYSAPGSGFETLDRSIITAGPARAKAIAFYLPQFHAIPENDAAWGTGFTEWRNICRGQPRFVGHYQPRVPRDLGFYDLTDPQVMRRQIELAKAAGVHGFCFYYYQFGRQRVLEKPIDQLLADPTLEMPFCLLWANENWTRRWDGQESEILLAQNYDEDSDRHLIESMAAAMSDPRYIRAEGRPLFFVYRPGIIPGMRARTERWRKLFRERGHDPWLLMAQSFYDHDPTDYGLDGAVEFPPHKLTTVASPITDTLNVLDPHFEGLVFDYGDVARASLEYPEPSYPLIKTAVPSWDNDARRQGTGTTLANATPKAYQDWLEALVERAREKPFAGEPFVFINAWNEWAEGAYLEPDVHFGSAYLNATARAVVGSGAIAAASEPHILLVGHDAHPHGAQMTLLNLGRCFKRQFGVRVSFLLLEGGRLLPRYEEIGDVVVTKPGDADFARNMAELAERGIGLALTNTVVTGAVVPQLKKLGMRVVSLVHELPRLIREFGIEQPAQQIARQSDVVVFAADLVREGFETAAAPVAGQSLILPQGLYAEIVPQPGAAAAVRKELDLAPEARIVLGVGYADLRKGIDLFLETARHAALSDPGLVFVWVGALEPAVATWLAPADEDGALPSNVRHIPFTNDIGRYLQAADAFYLTSREDPFPSTVIEALACGLPVVGFAGRTGTGELIERFGRLVPAFDTAAAARALRAEIDADAPAKVEERKAVVARDFRWSEYAFRLLQQLRPAWKRISAVVPNYNYAHYLEERLDSIFRQSVPVYEIIVLDDASTDGSLKEIERVARERDRVVRIVANAANSGSIMKQWAKAANEASGDLLWICEADDGASPDFLAKLVAEFGPDTVMACTDSRQVDSDGGLLAESYAYYFTRFVGSALSHSFHAQGRDFAANYLSIANLLINVSSVLFRRETLVEVFEREVSELQHFRFAGDWLVYLGMCQAAGDVFFCAEPLNVHRRHTNSTTQLTAPERHIDEVVRVHRAFARLFGAGETLRERQRTYRGELRDQFGLPPEKGDATAPADPADAPLEA